MNSFVQLIHESLNQAYDYRVNSKRGTDWFASFETEDDRSYDMFIQKDHRAPAGYFYMEFDERNNSAGNLNLTGKGDAFKIMATVINFLKEWLASKGKQKNVQGLIVAANKTESGARVSLYRKLMKKYMPKGWEVAPEEELNWLGGPTYVFITIRKKS